MADHGQFLELLLQNCQVFLLNRYADDGLGFTDDALRVFLPDLHWINAADMELYPNYHFNGLGGDLFSNLLGLLEQAHNAIIYQTGDRLDFWRASVPKHTSPEQTFAAIVGDPAIGNLHKRLNDFGPTLLRGNHDRWMADIADDGPCPETKHDPTNKVFLTHGHIWDQIERLPDQWKAWAVSISKRVAPNTYRVGPIVPGAAGRIRLQLKDRRSNPAGATHLQIDTIGAAPIQTEADIQMVRDTWLDISGLQVASLTTAFDDFHDVSGIVAFGGDVRERARDEGKDCHLFVIGHTHHARLLVDRHPLGGPLVLMDCGAWIENCTVQGGASSPSAQFGVQYGNELRIYQVIPK